MTEENNGKAPNTERRDEQYPILSEEAIETLKNRFFGNIATMIEDSPVPLTKSIEELYSRVVQHLQKGDDYLAQVSEFINRATQPKSSVESPQSKVQESHCSTAIGG
jgi:hypothetical protein